MEAIEMVLMKLIICIPFIASSYASQHAPEVTTPLGKIQGYYKTSYEGKQFAAFEGIPFAQPPVGALRFKEPQEMLPWNGTWPATLLQSCLQLNMFFGGEPINGQEDCLYINVYTPNATPNPDDNFDVIVHIHGGAFMMGFGHSASPHMLVDRNYIFVTFNYRVGILGFFCTMNAEDDVSCNNGLKDQSMALRWIKENIRSFGGNPDSVTITGASAGGASVHFQYLSPLSKGLFHRGYAQGGNAMTSWAMQADPTINSFKVAERVGCTDPKGLISCLRNRPAKQLTTEVQSLYKFIDYFPLVPFGPSLEPTKEGAFLEDCPRKVLESGRFNDVPFMQSMTKEEWVAFAYLTPMTQFLEYFHENWDDLVHSITDTEQSTTEENRQIVARKIREVAFGNEKITLTNLGNFVKLMTQRQFHGGLQESSQLQAKFGESPVYDFITTYTIKNSLFLRQFIPNYESFKNKGAYHGCDMEFLYGGSFGKFEETDEKMSKIYLDMIDSFVKTNAPKIEGVDWKPVPKEDRKHYLHINGPGDYTLEEIEDLGNLKFWKGLNLKGCQ